MTLFHGCCVYAHGGFVTAGLLLSAIFGVVCSTFSANSCRFVVVSFVSDQGNFDSMFYSENPGTDGPQNVKAAAGLYSWLMPSSDDNWNQGSCTGYTQTALNVISDGMFEAARIIVVIAILLGLGIFVWILTFACLSLGQRQVYLLAACQLLLVMLTSLTFLVKQSALCQDVGQGTSCTVDEGGLIMIGASVSWFFGFLITVFFMKSPEKQRREREEEIQRRAEELAEEKREKAVLKRKRKEEKEAAMQSALMDQEVARSNDEPTPSTPVTVESGDDDWEMEVYMSRSLDRIESIIDDDNSSF